MRSVMRKSGAPLRLDLFSKWIHIAKAEKPTFFFCGRVQCNGRKGEGGREGKGRMCSPLKIEMINYFKWNWIKNRFNSWWKKRGASGTPDSKWSCDECCHAICRRARKINANKTWTNMKGSGMAISTLQRWGNANSEGVCAIGYWIWKLSTFFSKYVNVMDLLTLTPSVSSCRQENKRMRLQLIRFLALHADQCAALLFHFMIICHHFSLPWLTRWQKCNLTFSGTSPLLMTHSICSEMNTNNDCERVEKLARIAKRKVAAKSDRKLRATGKALKLH